MQLAEFAQIATDIAGEKHRFRFLQLPFNLGMTEALTLGNQSMGGRDRTVMEAASELGITLVASASLLQGQVARNLPAQLRRGSLARFHSLAFSRRGSRGFDRSGAGLAV